jgi:histidyl-tRNA synthetase
MGKAPTKPVSGMRDHLPAAALNRREAFRRVENAFAAHGFVPLETPAMERLSTLLGKYGEEGDKLIYRVLHRGERLARALGREPVEPGDLSELGLRYDLTVPLARVTAEYRADLPAVFRRYQIQSVWRADRAQRGRFREFTQCDADIVGSRSLVADAEALVVLHAALTALGFTDFTIQLNHRELLRALITASGIPDRCEQETLVVLDKIGKIGRDAVEAELGRVDGVGPDRARRLLELVPEGGEGRDGDLDRLRHLGKVLPEGSGQGAASDLIALCDALDGALGETAPLRFSPSLARGLSYYTGPIFEVVAAGGAGSLAGGGRYDGLVGMFSGKETPAVGFSLGMERILMLLEEGSAFSATNAAPQAMLCPLPGIAVRDVLRVARTLRAAGVRLDVQVDPLKLGKQIGRAVSAGIPCALILGPDELADDRCTVRNLDTGEQRTLPLGQVAETLRG